MCRRGWGGGVEAAGERGREEAAGEPGREEVGGARGRAVEAGSAKAVGVADVEMGAQEAEGAQACKKPHCTRESC